VECTVPLGSFRNESNHTSPSNRDQGEGTSAIGLPRALDAREHACRVNLPIPDANARPGLPAERPIRNLQRTSRDAPVRADTPVEGAPSQRPPEARPRDFDCHSAVGGGVALDSESVAQKTTKP